MLCLVVLTCLCEGKDQQHSSVGMNQGLHKKVSIFDSNAFLALYKATFVVVHPLSPSLSILLLTLAAKMSTKEHPFLFYYTKGKGAKA